MEIRTVTVIGATGAMGANISGIFASFGDAKVYMLGRDIEKVKRTIPRVIKSVRADSIAKNLIPADFSMLDECVKASDLVFESSLEDIEVKKDIANSVAKSLREDAISCTGTSGFSINVIAECYPERLRGNFFGVHMFNPPYNMSLCEFIPTKYSKEKTKIELKKYLAKKLFRTVVEVKDCPAFLGNRIGFQFINEALQSAEKYKDKGGIDYVDAILGPHTGRSMAPLLTADFVGLDVHKAIVDNIYNNTSDYVHSTFELPQYVQRLVEGNKLGKKTGDGLYKTVKGENGRGCITVFDIAQETYREKTNYVFPFVEKMTAYFKDGDYKLAFEELVNNQSLESEICLSFMLKYIIYSLYTVREVGYSINAADDVMATGFNWCPPRAMYQALSTVANVKDLICQRIDKSLIEKIDVEELLDGIHSSQYDYRAYFKSV